MGSGTLAKGDREEAPGVAEGTHSAAEAEGGATNSPAGAEGGDTVGLDGAWDRGEDLDGGFEGSRMRLMTFSESC